MWSYAQGVKVACNLIGLEKHATRGALIARLLERAPALESLVAYGPGIAATGGAGAGIGALTAPEGERGRGALRGALIGGGLASAGVAASRLADRLPSLRWNRHTRKALDAITEHGDFAVSPTMHYLYKAPLSYLPHTLGIPLGVGAASGLAGGLSTKKKPWHERLRERLGG